MGSGAQYRLRNWASGCTPAITINVRRQKREADPALPERFVAVQGTGRRCEPGAA